MSVKLIQNFEYLENFSLNGNAAISTVHKFGNKSVAFSGLGDYVSVSNNSGLFNINSNSVRNFECFFKPAVNLDNFNWNSCYAYIFNGHVFRLSDYSCYWHDAKAACEAMGGHLATSTSSDKHNFIASLANNNNVWLGGTDEDSEGNWHWITGEDWSYSNWRSGEPNNSHNSEHFLCIQGNAAWNNNSNDNNYLFICEWDSLHDAYWGLNGYAFFNGHSFKFFNKYLTWHDANSFCDNIGGHLATSTSSEKNGSVK